MKTYHTNQIKNVVLLGNSSSGKTTMVESMMFEGKVIDRRGTISLGNTLSDFTEIEKIYARSIYSTVLYTEFMDHKLNILDTPDTEDFIGDVISSLHMADTCVLLVNAQNGMEVGTELFERWAEKYNKPMVIAVNQLDTEKANWENTIESIQACFGSRIVLAQYPYAVGSGFDGYIDILKMKMYKHTDLDGTRLELEIPEEEKEHAAELHNALIEAAAEHDEKLMEMYFEKGVLSEEEIREGLSIGLRNRTCFPVFCTSAKKNIGTKRLMEFIINVAQYPNQRTGLLDTEGKEISCDSSGTPSLYIFKTSVEPHIGEVSYFRVLSGKLTEGLDMVNASNGSKERISVLYASAGKKREKVTEMYAGDIGCTVKLKNSKAGQTLNVGSSRQLQGLSYPSPRYWVAIKAKNEADDEKLSELLNRAHQEDPTILVEYSKELKQQIIRGQGEHQIKVLQWHLEKVHKIEVDFIEPKIPYRETITKTASASYRHKKQSGGAGQFGEVHLAIEPHIEGSPDKTKIKTEDREVNLNIRDKEEHTLPWGGKLVFYNCIVGGAIDTRFLPAILKGVMDRMEEGPLTGSYARDIRVYVYDGKMHPVDSNELSFRLAGRNAFREAFKKAGPKIMEPVYNVRIQVPSDVMGDVISDMQNRRALIEGMDSEKGFEIINTTTPLAEMYKYSTTLSSITSARATFSMQFKDYQQVPTDVQDKLLKAYEAQEKEE